MNETKNKNIKDVATKTCSICNITTNTVEDTISFGQWLSKYELQVHYFCLLLSNDLPQNGTRDTSGILGFLINDIRHFIEKIKNNICFFCKKSSASIRCSGGCDKYYHLVCGRQNDCSFQFDSRFHTYCEDCVVKEDFYIEALKLKPEKNTLCFICLEGIMICMPTLYVYGTCCRKGFAHRICMQKYALEAGYYLRCIWCKDKNFRDTIRKQGIFVPDQDASWERDKNLYRDLHRKHSCCNAEICHSKRGRDYIDRKWSIILCSLCGSFGMHNPNCVPGLGKKAEKIRTFSCDTCKIVASKKNIVPIDEIDATLATLCSNETNITLIEQNQQNPTDSQQKTIDLIEILEDTLPDEHNQFQCDENIQSSSSCSLTDSNVIEDSIILDVFKFDEEKMICYGSGKIQININDERFKTKTKEQIISEKLYNDNDLILQTDDIGFFKKIDKIIEQHLLQNN